MSTNWELSECRGNATPDLWGRYLYCHVIRHFFFKIHQTPGFFPLVALGFSFMLGKRHTTSPLHLVGITALSLMIRLGSMISGSVHGEVEIPVMFTDFVWT